MKIPLKIKVLGMKIKRFIGATENVINLMPSIPSQMVTYRSKHPVIAYKSIEELSSDMSKVKWTEDPWDGKLDVIKHPTFFMEAIEKHPNYADDCDGFAAFAAVAIKKNHLAKEAWLGTIYWANKNTNAVDGHAVCIYKDNSGWHWIGNWNKCQPYDCAEKESWVKQVEDIVKSEIISAYMYPADRDGFDSLILLPPIIVK